MQPAAKPVPCADRLNGPDPTIAEVGLKEEITGVGVGAATVSVATGETL